MRTYTNKEIPLSKIHREQNHSRLSTNEAEHLRLMKSIQENGLIHPVTVNDKGNGEYELVAGFRRFYAFERLGYGAIPARVVNLQPGEDFGQAEEEKINYQENYVREQVSLLDAGCKWNNLMEAEGLTVAELAIKFGCPERKVENALRAWRGVKAPWRKRLVYSDDPKVKATEGVGLFTDKKAVAVVGCDKNRCLNSEEWDAVAVVATKLSSKEVTCKNLCHIIDLMRSKELKNPAEVIALWQNGKNNRIKTVNTAMSFKLNGIRKLKEGLKGKYTGSTSKILQQIIKNNDQEALRLLRLALAP